MAPKRAVRDGSRVPRRLYLSVLARNAAIKMANLALRRRAHKAEALVDEILGNVLRARMRGWQKRNMLAAVADAAAAKANAPVPKPPPAAPRPKPMPKPAARMPPVKTATKALQRAVSLMPLVPPKHRAR